MSVPAALSVGKEREGSVLYLTFICVVSALGGLLFGFDVGVISGILTPLRAQFMLSPVLEGWLVSSGLLACAIGAGLSGMLSDRFGRKSILLVAGWLFVLGSVGCALAWSVDILISSRVIGGVGVGLASMVSPLYISEVSLPRLRGRMVTLFQFALTIGICLSRLSNAWLHQLAVHGAGIPSHGLYRWMIVDQVWRSMYGMELFPALLFTLFCFVIPETPRWLIKVGHSERALEILNKIGGRAVGEKEMREIQETIGRESGSITQLFAPGLRRALFVGLFLAIVSELSGITVVLYYGPGILEKAGFSLGQALGGFVSIGLVNVVFTVIAIWLMDSVGRRPLLFIGSTGAFLALGSIGLLFLAGYTERSACQHDVSLCGLLRLLHGANQVGGDVGDFSNTNTGTCCRNRHSGRMGDGRPVQPDLPDGSKQSRDGWEFSYFRCGIDTPVLLYLEGYAGN